MQAAWASEIPRQVEATWAAEAHPSFSIICTKPRKGHLPETSQNHEMSKFSIRKLLSNKNLSVFVLHRDFPCSMPAFQNLTHQPEAPFWQHSGRFTFRPRYQVDTIVTLDHLYFTSDFFKSSFCTWYETDGNQQNSINPCFTGRQVTLLKGLCCWSQRWVQAAWAEFEHRFSTKPRKSTSAQNHEKSKFSSRKPWVYFEQQKSVRVCFA